MAMHAQPGVYALLLGSGVSTGAEIPTGWGVITDLVKHLAVAEAPDDPQSHQLAGESPEKWWSIHGDGQPLGYSSLLAGVATTQAARQGLLRKYFEADDADRELGRKVPSAAHLAIAELVKRGTVKVVVTTNFDRLLEQALEGVGVQAQVLTRADAVAGMSPLAHAGPTVIKLHGDYTELDSRNTVDELSDYPPAWTDLLTRIFSEYGLLISGWSAEWDRSLVATLQASPRRYPLYWDSRSSNKQPARQLLSSSGGHIIEASSADDLFKDLLASVEALDRLAEPPLTTAMAIAQMKRFLPDPVRRIDLHDLVMGRLDPVRDAVEQRGSAPISGEGADGYDAALNEYLRASTPLLELLITGVRYDDGTHRDLWGEVLDRLLALHRQPKPGQVYNDTMLDAQLYPALLAFYAMSAASVAVRRDELMISLARDHAYDTSLNPKQPVPVAFVLRPDSVLDYDAINRFSRWNGTKWQVPPSHLIREHLSALFEELFAQPPRELFDDVEFRHAVLIATVTPPESYYQRPLWGEFLGDRYWSRSLDETLQRLAERFGANSMRTGSDWPWWTLIGAGESARDRATELLKPLYARDR